MKGKRGRCLGLSVLLGLLAASFFALSVKEYAPYVRNEIQMRKLRDEIMEDGGKDKKGKRINWEKLQEINPDIIAWIRVPGTKVDYPVLKCASYSYYLHRNEKKQENVLGSIFVQPETAEDFTDCHTVIYGHNMSDKQMFGSLHEYESEEFWQDHPDVYLYQPGKKIHAVIYSVYDVQDRTDTYEVKFRTKKEWRQWIRMSVEQGYYRTDVRPKKKDRVITLSTCSNGRGRSSRFVVNCVIETEKSLNLKNPSKSASKSFPAEES